MLSMQVGNMELALRQFSLAATHAEEMGMYGVWANVQVSRAQAQVILGDIDGAVVSRERARAEMARVDDQLGLWECEKVSGMISRERGNHEEAEGQLRAAATGFSSVSNPLGEAESQYELALLYERIGRITEAKAEVLSAKAAFVELSAALDIIRCEELAARLG